MFNVLCHLMLAICTNRKDKEQRDFNQSRSHRKAGRPYAERAEGDKCRLIELAEKVVGDARAAGRQHAGHEIGDISVPYRMQNGREDAERDGYNQCRRGMPALCRCE